MNPPIGKHRALMCIESAMIAAVLLIQPSAVLAAARGGVVTELTPGATVTIPTNAINEESRIVTVCTNGGPPHIVRWAGRSKATFRCGDDPKMGVIQCPDKGEKLTRKDGFFCSQP
jgi:hypothetical protein